jgi:hypothetical protein
MHADYDGRQVVGIDLHRRRSVIVRMTEAGEKLATVRIDNDPVALGFEIAKAGADAQVVLEASMAGTGRPMCCGPPVPRCIWRIRWGRRVSRIGGSRTTYVTPPIWPTCCGFCSDRPSSTINTASDNPLVELRASSPSQTTLPAA